MALAGALRRLGGSLSCRVLARNTTHLQARASVSNAVQRSDGVKLAPTVALRRRSDASRVHLLARPQTGGRSLATFSRGGSLAAASDTPALHEKIEPSIEAGEDEYTDNTKLVCEFTVQTLFNFLSCTAVATSHQLAAGNALHQTLMVMGAHSVILPMLIFVFMPISGAHFNPMVTASMVAAGQLPLKLGIGYVFAQLAGAVTGSYAAFFSLPGEMQTAAMAGIQAVPPDHTIAQAFLGEVMASFFFLSVLFGCLTDKRGWGKLGPLAVPLAICLLMWLVGPISSMCINPARAFGPAVVTGMWENHWVWWTAPFIGGPAAAVLYSRLFLPLGQRPKPFK